MKSIGAQSTSGHEAISIAIIMCWMEEAQIFKNVEELAEKAGAHAFTSFHDWSVGYVVYSQTDLWQQFSKYMTDNPRVHAIWKLSLAGESSFKESIATDLGIALKKSEWWTKNIAEMERAKRNLKKVRKVMES